MFLSLLPFAKEHGVKIATENMWNWDREKGESSFAACATAQSFLAHLDAVHDPDFVACLDIGHAEMRPAGDGAAAMIRALGHHLQALHIHDVNYVRDCHTLPFMEKLPWEDIMAALGQTGYAGDFTFEANNFLRNLPVELLEPACAFMARTGRYLMSRIQAHRA